MERHILRLSKALYIGLCGKIGTSTQIKIRRDVLDTEDIINKLNSLLDVKTIWMISGSYREGFRLKTSDMDTMFWFTDDIIIHELSMIPAYPTQTVMLMECHDTPPGFAKLKLLTPTNDPIIRQSCVSVNNQVYISSSLYKEKMQSLVQQMPFAQSFKPHGPCASGFVDELEQDFALCFSCQHWPPTAYLWIERCQRKGWPSPQVLQDIISDGCHLVAIGSGRSIAPQQVETEWRMSFSNAEYKLVSSMNHSLFLCYGLLKIFLKEVLNDGLENPLLCSYFMKTTLFWKIQENANFHWSSQNLLHCVWVCFKYLIQCVYRGEFPNFFIPQSNMFINKVHGVTQNQLFLQLLNLYNMGISCLLLSPTLHHILAEVILNPHLEVSTNENNIISEIELDIELSSHLGNLKTFKFLRHFDQCLQAIKYIDNIYNKISPTSQNHIVTLHVMRNTILIHAAFYLEKTKRDNVTDVRPLDMLISAAESGFISDMLYVAMYLYSQTRYTEALHYIETTKQKLSQPYVLDIHNPTNVNIVSYMEAVGGQSLIEKVKKTMASHVLLDEVLCFDEVRLELFVNDQYKHGVLYVPPLVMAHMLSFLCHHHLGDRLRSRQSLDDLQTLLTYGEEQYIHFQLRDISWQLLGICEEIEGEKERALDSYQKSLQKYPTHKIHTASWTRIQNIMLKSEKILGS